MVGRIKLRINFFCDNQGFHFLLLRCQCSEFNPQFLDLRHALGRFVQVNALGQLLHALPDDLHCLAIGKDAPVALYLIIRRGDARQLKVAPFTRCHPTPQSVEVA